MRQVAHFIGNHGKTTAAFASARGFNGSVKGQQVGLVGNGANHFKHRTNLFAAVGKLLHFFHAGGHFTGKLLDGMGGGADQLQAFASSHVGAAGRFGGLSCVACNVLGGGAHFL
ncbi:hypothetical protein D3C77_655880 [compost metagenome]